jgi:hypothetical protein
MKLPKRKSNEEKEIKKKMLANIKEHPELNIQVNLIRKDTGFIEEHSIYATKNKFKIESVSDFEYELKPSGLVLEPTKDSFKPFYVFKEGEKYPMDFSNKNKRIPSRVLTLLYNLDTYRILIVYESKNINLILVIIGVITLVVLAIYGWLNFGHGQLPKIPFLNG